MKRLLIRPGDVLSFESLFLATVFVRIVSSADATNTADSKWNWVLGGAGALVAAWLVFRRGVIPTGMARKYLLLQLVFVLYQSLSHVFAPVFSEDANLVVVKTLLMNTWTVCAAFLVVNDRQRIERLLRVLFAYAALLAVLVLAESLLMGKSLMVSGFGAADEHAGQGAGRIIAMGVILAMVVLCQEGNPLGKLVLGGGTALMAFAILLSGSRQALAGILVAAAFLLCTLWRSGSLTRVVWRMAWAGLIIGGCAVAVHSLLLSQVDLRAAEERMTGFLGADRIRAIEASERPELWASGVRIWTQYPLFGCGIERSREFLDPANVNPHNLFLVVLAELGLVGLVLQLPLLWIPLRILVRKPPADDSFIPVALGALWLLLFTCTMVSGGFDFHRQLYLISMLIVVHASGPPVRLFHPQACRAMLLRGALET